MSASNPMVSGARAGDGRAPTRSLRFWLPLAASPAFALMAAHTAVLQAGPSNPLCATGQDGFALTGMVPMYLLMAIFHAAPWLKLIGR